MAFDSASVSIKFAVKETVTDTASYANAARSTVVFDGGGLSESLDADSTPPADSHAVGKQALTAGAATIDLTSLTGVNGAAVSLSGKTPIAVLFENTGANAMTIAKGASNGYTGFGSSYSETIPAGGKVVRWLDENGTAVSGSDKTLDVTGTGTQELKYQILAGA
jgi:hypothetical protein